MNCKEQSGLKLSSNIISKDVKIGLYIPFDLKPKEYLDVRKMDDLTDNQKRQYEKALYGATEIRDEFQRFPDMIENKEMCKDCKYKDICY
ncbi:MAG: hypothetical protein J6C23_01765 [Clostridia bacterium]|nr:hypothetical protein [Clostridia bacterium]